jgi:predicted dehydrogenase
MIMSKAQKVRFGVVGLGGYAIAARNTIWDLAKLHPELLQLDALYSPDAADHPTPVADLKARGVKVCDSLEALLAEPIDAVWLPTPIDTHRPLTVSALEAGKAVLCEKPAAGSIDDVDLMIAARDRAGKPVAIGFQDMHHPTTLAMKRDLLGGRIGKLQHASVHVIWPRASTYFGRAPWAGKFRRNGNWIMDSIANNACAHYLALPLFLLGSTLEKAATPLSIEAELYRANPIENFDTISMRLELDSGLTLLVLMTHAASTSVGPVLRVEGDKGLLQWTQTLVRWEEPGGAHATERDPYGGRLAMLERFCHAVQGVKSPLDVLPCSLEVARQQVLAVNAASEATPIHTMPQDAYTEQPFTSGGTVRVVPGIERALETCALRRQMLHELGQYHWTRPAGQKDLRGYRHFAGPVGLCAQV